MERSAQWPTTSLGLLSRLRQPEDRLSWERFLSEYAPPLRRLCQKHRVLESDTDDIVQAVFLGVSRRIGVFEYSRDKGRFRSWLSTIALRAIWRLQQNAREHPLQLMDPRALAARPVEQPELLEEINASVMELVIDRIQAEFDGAEWDAFVSVWLKGTSAREVADRLGRPASWVYKVKFNVLRRMNVVVRQISEDLACI